MTPLACRIVTLLAATTGELGPFRPWERVAAGVINISGLALREAAAILRPAWSRLDRRGDAGGPKTHEGVNGCMVARAFRLHVFVEQILAGPALQ